VTGRTVDLYKPASLITNVLFWNKLRKKTKGNRLTRLENCCQNRQAVMSSTIIVRGIGSSLKLGEQRGWGARRDNPPHMGGGVCEEAVTPPQNCY